MRSAGWVLACIALGACAAGPAERIEPGALWARIQAGDAPVVVDVRSRREYESGHVPGAVHLPFQSTWSLERELPAPPRAPVVLYCEHGPRSALARYGLESIGFERVLVLDGHMTAWREAGLPVEPGPAP